MRRLIGIYGASGFGREVMAVARSCYLQGDTEFVFVDDYGGGDKMNSHDVVSLPEFCRRQAPEKMMAIAIADGAIRKRLANRCAEAGLEQCKIQASNVWVGDNVQIGSEAILQPFVSLTSNIVIGRSFHANIYSYVAHDCEIGDFVTFAPRVNCNGNVVIEDHAYVGTGAIIRQGSPGNPIIIGAGAVVGMGAVVTKNVAPGATVVGNPARPIESIRNG